MRNSNFNFGYNRKTQRKSVGHDYADRNDLEDIHSTNDKSDMKSERSSYFYGN
jgi:hypothetical protein